MRRREQPPDDLAPAREAFATVLAEIGGATAALTEVMPTSRLPGRPLPDALVEFEERLTHARTGMPAWRRPGIEETWTRCDAALDEALRRAAELRETAPDLGGFEGLIWAVDRLTAPLDPFDTAADWFRRPRTLGATRGPPSVV